MLPGTESQPKKVLQLIAHLHFEGRFWFLVVTNWIVFLGAWLLCALVGRWRGWSRQQTGALILVAGLGNTAFIGYPMVLALRGSAGLSLAVIGDQTGCFTALAVGGVLVAGMYGGHTVRAGLLVRRIVLFPPFIALLVAIVAGRFGGWPSSIEALLAALAGTLTPLALFSVGLQQRWRLDTSHRAPLALGLVWKLLLAPLGCYALGIVSGAQGLVLVIGVLQAAMPPMISAAIMAEQSGLDGKLANAVLGFGILLSLASVPAINAWL